jgi:hypothetical protein
VADLSGVDWSYHDLYITTAQIPRTRLFNLPYGLWVTCSRVAGWELWDMSRNQNHETLPPSKGALMAGEYADPGKWLVLDVAGYIIVDSRRVSRKEET